MRSAVQIRSRAPYDKADMKISAFVLTAASACMLFDVSGLVGLVVVKSFSGLHNGRPDFVLGQ